MTRTALKDALLAELSAHSLDCQEYMDSVRSRVTAGKADHVELFLQHRYGKPPDRVQVEQRPRVLQIVLRRELGSYDPLAPGAEEIIDAAPQPRPPAEPPLK